MYNDAFKCIEKPLNGSVMEPLAVIKFSAILASGIFGVCALLGEARDQNGNLSKWGRINIGGILLSAIIAAMSLALEIQQTEADSKQRDQETKKLLLEVRRAVNPLMPAKTMIVDISLDIPLTHQALSDYRKHLQHIIEQIKRDPKRLAKFPDTKPLIGYGSDDEEGKMIGLLFGSDSPANPYSNYRLKLRQVFDNIGIECWIVDPTKTEVKLNGNFWRNRTGIHFNVKVMDGKVDYETNLEASFLIINVRDVDLNTNESWQTDGSIMSLDDLAGKQLEISGSDGDFGRDSEIELRNELQNQLKLRSFELLAANRRFFIGHWERNNDGKDGWPEYVYTFPPDLLNREINLHLINE